jgi:hypothetical protein
MSPQAIVNPGCRHIITDGNEPQKDPETGKMVPTGKPGRVVTAEDGPIEVSEAELAAYSDKLTRVGLGGKPVSKKAKENAEAAG